MTNVNEKTTRPESKPVKDATSKSVSVFKEPELENVFRRVSELQAQKALVLPADYEAAGALRAAWFKILELEADKKCTKESIQNSLFRMVSEGMNIGKRQCSLIIRGGNKLTYQREYQGNVLLAKRYGDVKDVHSSAIFKDDVFVYTTDPKTGKKEIVKHETKLENIDKGVIGAYAVVTMNDNSSYAEIMSMKQIQISWEMSGNGLTKAHKNFPDQMAEKTVKNRILKDIINSSDDAGLMVSDDEHDKDYVAEEVKENIRENANKGDVISIDELQKQEVEDTVIVEEEAITIEEPEQTGYGPGY